MTQLYVFDLDRTLFKKNCSFVYFFYLFRKGFYSVFDLIRAFFFFLLYFFFFFTPTELQLTVFALFLKNRKAETVFFYSDDFLNEYFNRLINHSVLAYLNQALRLGYKVIILSNSPHLLIQKIAAKLNVADALGSSYVENEKGELIAIDQIIDGQAKAEYIQNNFKEERVIVFTDSIWDKPLLDIADTCFVVNPDLRLRRLAKRENWRILS